MERPPAPLDLSARQVTRAQAGDPVAFRWLFERDGASVRRFLHDLLRDRDSADEATQETFVRAHRQLPGLQAPERWRPWLFGIARRVSLETMRRRRTAPQVLLDETHERPDRAPDPEAALIAAESDRVLGRALDGIDDERRAALLLRVDHGLDYDSIAAILGWPLSKVKNEIHRARLQLRATVGDYVQGVS